jgi:hypothetical protein
MQYFLLSQIVGYTVDIEALMLLDHLGEYRLAQYADPHCGASTGTQA